MTENVFELTGVLADIAEVAGNGAALSIAAEKGGGEAYIPLPENLKIDHWLVKLVGLDKAKKIAKRIGGGAMEIPMGPFAGNRAKVWRAIRIALKNGKSTRQAAKMAGVHVRTVFRHKAGDSGASFDEAQGELF
jgi:hypothetical protein